MNVAFQIVDAIFSDLVLWYETLGNPYKLVVHSEAGLTRIGRDRTGSIFGAEIPTRGLSFAWYPIVKTCLIFNGYSELVVYLKAQKIAEYNYQYADPDFLDKLKTQICQTHQSKP